MRRFLLTAAPVGHNIASVVDKINGCVQTAKCESNTKGNTIEFQPPDAASVEVGHLVVDSVGPAKEDGHF